MVFSSGLSLALAATAPLAPSDFRYLSCLMYFQGGSADAPLRWSPTTGVVELQYPDGDIRKFEGVIAKGVIQFKSNLESWTIDTNTLAAVRVVSAGGEGHWSNGQCVKHNASEYIGKKTIWSPKPLSRKPTPMGDADQWITLDDYPPFDRQNRHEGDVQYVLQVGSEGRAVRCFIAASSGYASLDQMTCKTLMRRARFKPALNAEGKPTTDSFSGRMRWQTP